MRYFILHIAILLLFNTQAQQLPQYSLWSQNHMMLNPAFTGIKKHLEFHSLYRWQWVGFDGAPRSGGLTFSAPIETNQKKYNQARQGIGVRFESDKIGQINTHRFNLSYAGHLFFKNYQQLSLGIYAGVIQFGLNSATTTTIESDPTVTREASFIAPDASVGLWWNGLNYYVGLSLNQLITSKWKQIGTDSRFSFHPMITAGYRLKINEKWTLMPAVLMKLPMLGPVVFDLQAGFDYVNKFQLGTSFRNGDALIFYTGYRFNQQFAIHYAFDFTLSPLKQAGKNTHEISISFTTKKPQISMGYGCPLY